MIKKLSLIAICIISTIVSSCSNQYKEKQHQVPQTSAEARDTSFGKVTGEEGIVFGGNKKRDTAGITVNAFLWRASLEAVSQLPLQIIDPFSGVITTDWYDIKEDKYKINIVIKSDVLRADGLQVTVMKNHNGKLTNHAKMANEIEGRILTRARFLKVNQ